MKLYELYERDINRKLNPAVSAASLDEETIATEIGEYVFTQEIIINLYNILNNIKLNQGSHVGIWINGYFGSGKSHFLKYTSYCISGNGNPAIREKAFQGLIDAIHKFHILGDCGKLDAAAISESELLSLKKWFVETANAQMVMFNIGDRTDESDTSKDALVPILWNQFNRLRGYNSSNLAAALFLEKTLDNDGKFDAFKQRMKEKGYNWTESQISLLTKVKLQETINTAKEVDPEIDVEATRENILKNRVTTTVDSFVDDVKEYLDKKNDRNIRILFFIDEVSQYIAGHVNQILTLQSIVKRLEEECHSQVWVACTAQQKIEDVVTSSGGKDDPNDNIGKILGRFEVRVSLEETTAEYITQKRILEKKGTVDTKLYAIYTEQKSKLDGQFVLPSTYCAYKDKEDFANYYPFVPYQFPLIIRVLDSFERMNYMDKQVKGNERSLLNIAYSIVKKTKDEEAGQFIVPFDQFFGPMLNGALQHIGQMALKGGHEAVAQIADTEKSKFCQRVLNVLFLICNLDDSEKSKFPANLENTTILLMSKIDENKLDLKQKVKEYINYLIEKSVIHIKTDDKNGKNISTVMNDDNAVYEFYTEEESKMAQIIDNTPFDSNTLSEVMKDIFVKNFIHTSINQNKFTYKSREFSVGMTVDSKSYRGSNNSDIVVDFIIEATSGDESAEQFAMRNKDNHLVFFLHSLYKENETLRKNVTKYCRIQRYAKDHINEIGSEEQKNILNKFKNRGEALNNQSITPELLDILNKCPVISKQCTLDTNILGNSQNQERSKRAFEHHLQNNYPQAHLIESENTPKNKEELKSFIIRRNVADAQIEGTDTLAEPEKRIKAFLDTKFTDVTVDDVVDNFKKPPYGWSEVATIFFTTELVRHHQYDFTYMGAPYVTLEKIASSIVSEKGSFCLVPAKVISQEIVNKFVNSWKNIFNVRSLQCLNNDTTVLFENCKKDNSDLCQLLKTFTAQKNAIASYPFANVFDNAISIMEKWKSEKDHLNFFNAIIQAANENQKVFDDCKIISKFLNDQKNTYDEIKNFITANNDNFNLLDNNDQAEINELKKLLTDQTPWNNFPPYNKLKRSVAQKIDQKHAELVNLVQTTYSDYFDQLEKYAMAQNVDRGKFAQRDLTLNQLTNTKNLYALQMNIGKATDFYAAQMNLINEAIPKTTSETNPTVTNESADSQKGSQNNPQNNSVSTDNEETTVSEPVQPTRTPRPKKIATVNFKVQRLHSEHDVDEYLKTIKTQLLSQLGDDFDIFIP